MRALYLDKVLTLREDYPAPTPPPGEALVRVRLAGVCNTDLELVRGYMSFRGVPGHEFVGEVVQSDSAPEWVGQRVVGEINAACGECETCRAGRPTHCPHRTTLGIAGRDGAFAEYLCLPIANLHHVPENLPDEAAVFAEPLAAACEITQAVHIHPTDRVAVLGDGKLGLLCAQVLQLTASRQAAGPTSPCRPTMSSSKPLARRKGLPRRAGSCAHAEPSCSSPRIMAR
jgi:alcohol dehydrogenase